MAGVPTPMRIALQAFALAAVLGASAASAAEPYPGYGVVQSITPLRPAPAKQSASAGASAPVGRTSYLVRVRMDDGRVQIRNVRQRDFFVGDRVLLTNAGDVVQDEPRRPSGSDASRGGSAPSDGAITGGSILPGERGGVPGADKPGEAENAIKRCNELSGTLRDECLLKEQSSTGSTTTPPDSGGARTRSPRDAPPPQNPR